MVSQAELAFAEKLSETLGKISPEILEFDVNEASEMAELYEILEEYAYKMRFRNTAVALPLLRGLLTGPAGLALGRGDGGAVHYKHGLCVCRLLVNLRLPVSSQEEDVCLAAALCHVLVEVLRFPDGGEELCNTYHLQRQVLELIQHVVRPKRLDRTEKEAFFQSIQEDPLALLVKLADRGHLLSLLEEAPVRYALEVVKETREYFFPMCIYGKEHYENLRGIIALMLEKMRSMMDVIEILGTRHEEQISSMMKEILSLKEENSRMRMLIEAMKKSTDEENRVTEVCTE